MGVKTCRQDTWSDLQLFAVVNLGVILLFGWLKSHLVDTADSDFPMDPDNKPFWLSIYQVGSSAPLLLERSPFVNS